MTKENKIDYEQLLDYLFEGRLLALYYEGQLIGGINGKNCKWCLDMNINSITINTELGFAARIYFDSYKVLD